MKKALKPSIVLCLILSVVTACSKTSEPKSTAAATTAQSVAPKATATNTPAPKQVTLKITHWIPETKEVVEKIDAAFSAANPGVKIEYSIVPGDQYENVLKTKLLAGDGPDVFFNFHDTADDLVANDLIGDLTGDPLYSRLLPQFQKLNAKGKFLSVPLEFASHGVYYNKDVFDKLGLQLPNSYADFLALCDKIKKAGIDPLALGAKDAWQMDNMWLPMFVSLGKAQNPNINAKLFDGTAKYSGPEVTSTFKAVEELVQKGYFEKGFLGLTWPQAAADFASGKAAMFVNGGFVIGESLKDNPNVKIGFFPFPAMTGKPAMMVTVNSDLQYNAKGANAALAKKYIEFFTQAENLKMYNEVSVLQSASTFVDVHPKLPAAAIEVMEDGKNYDGYSADFFAAGQVAQLWSDAVHGVFAGQKVDMKTFEKWDQMTPEEKKADPKMLRPAEEANK